MSVFNSFSDQSFFEHVHVHVHVFVYVHVTVYIFDSTHHTRSTTQDTTHTPNHTQILRAKDAKLCAVCVVSFCVSAQMCVSLFNVGCVVVQCCMCICSKLYL